MAETESPKPDLERFKAVIAAAEGKLTSQAVERFNAAIAAAERKITPHAVSELVKAAFVLAHDDPTFESGLVKAVEDSPEVRAAFQIGAFQTILEVLRKCGKSGTTKEEILETAKPFIKDEQDREALMNLHALGQTNRALELLLGETYHSSMPGDDSLICFGLTREQFSALPPDERFHRITGGLTRDEFTALPPVEALKRIIDALPVSNQLPSKTSYIDSVYETADLIFEQRYGWPAGTVKALTIKELWFALENTLEDKTNDPKGVWILTS